jgi:hypothetical protein
MPLVASGGLAPEPPDPPKPSGHYTPINPRPVRRVPQAVIDLQTEGFRGALRAGMFPDEMGIDILQELVGRSELDPLLYESVFFYDVDTLRALLSVDVPGTNWFAASVAEVYTGFASVLEERPVAVCGQTANAIAEIVLGANLGGRLVEAATRVHRGAALNHETAPALAWTSPAMLRAALAGTRRAIFVCSLGVSHRFVLLRYPTGQVEILQGWFDNAAIQATGYALATWLAPGNAAKYRRPHGALADDLAAALLGDLQASMRVFKPAGTTLQDNDFDITGLRFTFAMMALDGGKLRAGFTGRHVERLTALFASL